MNRPPSIEPAPWPYCLDTKYHLRTNASVAGAGGGGMSGGMSGDCPGARQAATFRAGKDSEDGKHPVIERLVTYRQAEIRHDLK